MALVLTGEHHGDILHCEVSDEPISIGRGTTNTLVLPSQTVSRNHAQMVSRGGVVYVTDLGSLNGTRVNHKSVDGEQIVEVGDVVEFGSVALHLSDGSAPLTPNWQDDDDLSDSILLSREATRTDEFKNQEPGLLQMVMEVGELLVVTGQSEDTFDRILELVEKQIPAHRIMVLLAEDGKEPVQRAARVKGDRALSPLMLSRTMVRMVMNDGTSVLTGDAQSDERFRNQQSIVAQDLRSAMAVPLTHQDDVLGVLYVDTNEALETYSERDLRVLTLLGQMLGTKVANARLLEVAAEQERLKEELRTAASIQKRLLPQKLPDVPGYEVLGFQETCEAVGGDLYDAAILPNGRLQFVLADVSGKGIPAALLMSDILATVRALRPFQLPLDDLANRLDRHVALFTRPEHYATMFLAEIDPGTHQLTYVNGGHPPAFVVQPEGEPLSLTTSGFPVGLLEEPMGEYEQKQVDFPPGSTLIVYSDGVSEAERGEEQFSDNRFAILLEDCRNLSATDCAQEIRRAVANFVGDAPATDDTTLFLVRRSR